MANQNGSIYGLTILSPIIDDPKADISHDCAIREYLACLPRDSRSPFAVLSSTHLARLVVMDDVIFVGTPAKEEHLQSKYLVFESNLDGDLDTYLTRMATETRDMVDAVWGHCYGYPGTQNVQAFIAYMKKCQIDTTFFFADVNNQTVRSTLRALKVQASVAEFIGSHQGKSPEQLLAGFRAFYGNVENMAEPVPGHPQEPGTHESIPLQKTMAARHG